MENDSLDRQPQMGECLPSMRPERDVRLDLLRCFAIVFIVLHHLAINNIGLSVIEQAVDVAFLGQYYAVSFLDCFVIIGVNLFFAISGYFSLRLKPAKMFSLLCKVYIYWLVGMLLVLAVDAHAYASVWDFCKQFIVAISKYWFVIVYMLLMLVAPVLNVFADYLSAKGVRIRYFIFISLLFFCVIGFISDYIYPYMGTDNGYTVIWAAVPYLYGRLIRLNRHKLKLSVPFWGVLYLAFCLANYAVVAALIACRQGALAWHFFSYNNPLVLGASLSFFMIFVSAGRPVGVRFGRAVSFVAAHSLAVYLVHSNNPFLSVRRAFLINLVNPLWAKLLVLLPNALLSVAIGVAVDWLYEWALSRPVGRFCGWLDSGVMWIFDKLSRLLARPFEAKNEQQDKSE